MLFKYMDELEQRGFTKEQAKTSVNLWIELMNENLANKNDLLELKSEVKDLVSKMDIEFMSVKYEIRDMESRITIKLGALMVTGIGLIALLQKL
jgi:hypothetical protein